jgi:hypothetical protein
MKKILLVMAMLSCLCLSAQQYPDFKPLRYDEDYRSLATDTSHGNWYKAVKYTPLSNSGNTFISFGGDIRYQYFYVKNENWGDDPKDPDGYLLTRWLFHADAHFGSHFRAFLQVQSSTADGKESTSPADLNPLDLHQAFADYTTSLSDNVNITLRLGRQELSYGSQRLVSVREGPNNRQAFDAAKIMLQKENIKADFFYSNYVVAQKDIFDDAFTQQRKFWGSYFTLSNFPLLRNLDIYYLGYRRNEAKFNDGQGREIRHSIGARSWGKHNGWRYDAEALYQFGKVGSKNISAWTASLNGGYEFSKVRFKPEIGLKAEVISGDRKEGNNSVQTFNPLFPRGAYFGLASVIGPSNLIDIHPSVNFELSKNIEWVIDYDMFWRYSSNDGIYAPNVAIIYPAGTSGDRKIGRQLESEIVFQPNKYLYFRAEITWFEAGDYLKASGAGKDIIFAGITTQLKF